MVHCFQPLIGVVGGKECKNCGARNFEGEMAGACCGDIKLGLLPEPPSHKSNAGGETKDTMFDELSTVDDY